MKEIAKGQSFKNIIRNQQIYIDKTQIINSLFKINDRIFLSRPRRFGKSLVLDTIATLFEKGVDPYFKDTWIYDKWKEKTYPVLRLNFLDFPTDDYDLFCEKFAREIQCFANKNSFDNYEEVSKDPSSCITEILRSVADKDAQIVILIDEYDAQLTSNINNEDLYKKFQQCLRNVYGTLKGKESIKFLGITGVTRIRDVSIFSVGSDILDITYQSSVSTITGFTREEIAKYYIDYLNLGVSLEQNKSIEEVTNQEREELIDRLAKEYNGYCFDKSNKKTVFSTFSVNLFFKDLYTEHEVSFGDYWYLNGGVPSILANYLENHKIDISEYQKKDISVPYEDFVNPTSLLSMNQRTLMAQTGYLTLNEAFDSFSSDVSLRIPNLEVKRALIKATFLENFGTKIKISTPERKMLEKGTFEDIKKVLIATLNSISYKRRKFEEELDLQNAYYSYFLGGGIDAIEEDDTLLGSCDLKLEFIRRRIIIELKYAHTDAESKRKLKEACEQVIDRDYGNKPPIKELIRIALVYNDSQKKIEYIEEVKS